MFHDSRLTIHELPVSIATGNRDVEVMFIQDRNESRGFFVEVWRKYQAGEGLEPLERLLLGVMLEHPEYHALLADTDTALGAEYIPEGGLDNPFLHMGMHIALREQVGADRPAGITAVYRRLLSRYDDGHALEHAMMECLGEALWSAQRRELPPDETAYMDCLKKL